MVKHTWKPLTNIIPFECQKERFFNIMMFLFQTKDTQMETKKKKVIKIKKTLFFSNIFICRKNQSKMGGASKLYSCANT